MMNKAMMKMRINLSLKRRAKARINHEIKV